LFVDLFRVAFSTEVHRLLLFGSHLVLD
jgi:hypothetical protein